MSKTICSAELVKALDLRTADIAAGPYTARLFTNNHTPAEADVLSDYTLASTGAMNSAKNLDSWGAAAYASGKASSTHAVLEWTHDGTGGSITIYGYVAKNTDGTLAWAELRADGPVTLSTAGEKFRVTPLYTIDN